MSDSKFMLSAFGDEIATDLEEQLTVLSDLRVPGLELRAAWGTNVLHLSDEEVVRARSRCNEAGIHVSALGSPVGKSPLSDPIENEEKNLRRLAQVGRILGSRRVRIFSFYPPDISTNEHYDQHVDEATERLSRLVRVAEEEDLLLLLENEKEIVGDTVDRCRALLAGIESDHLTFAWDPANFVQVGEERVTERAWPILGKWTGYVHIKDALLGGGVKAAGEGDGQIAELLTRLKESNYRGVLALEPHLAVAGHSSGFSGPDGMAYAVEKLREVMSRTGCVEVQEPL